VDINWDVVEAVAEMLGAVGVLLTLFYLASQIRDNTRSLQAASLESVLNGARDRYFLPMSTDRENVDVFTRGLNSLDLLDENEKRRFYYQLFEQLFQMQQVMHLRERDLIPQVDYDAWLTYTTSLLRTPGGAAMWLYCEATITPTIAQVINEHLKENPGEPSYIELAPLFCTEDSA
jgi:hypothetical protein